MADRSLPPSYEVTLRDATVSLLVVALSRGVGGEALHRSCISQKILFPWLETTEIKLPASGPCCAQRLHLFSSGTWQIGQFAISSLSWEVVTHPSQHLLPEAIHHHVSSKPSLVPFYGSEAKERGAGKGGTDLRVLVSYSQMHFCLSGCMTRGEHPPHPRCAGTGVARHQGRQAQSTDRSLELVIPSLVPLGTTGTSRPLPGRGSVVQSICHLKITCWFAYFGYLTVSCCYLLLLY